MASLPARKPSTPSRPSPAKTHESRPQVRSRKKSSKNFAGKYFPLSLHSQSTKSPQLTVEKEWELSSAGLEHLPYKQRVDGSIPPAPTSLKRFLVKSFRLFLTPSSFCSVFETLAKSLAKTTDMIQLPHGCRISDPSIHPSKRTGISNSISSTSHFIRITNTE